jgi:hypothetical protein
MGNRDSRSPDRDLILQLPEYELELYLISRLVLRVNSNVRSLPIGSYMDWNNDLQSGVRVTPELCENVLRGM